MHFEMRGQEEINDQMRSATGRINDHGAPGLGESDEIGVWHDDVGAVGQVDSKRVERRGMNHGA